jgi:hypothetical protein
VHNEPHLLTAILTVASKNELSFAALHAALSGHMESLISSLIYTGSISVGAVEALLILAEWAPRRLESTPTIGKGEEDQCAWMLVGCAIRLGYLQRLEQSCLNQDKVQSDEVGRHRLVWSGKKDIACQPGDSDLSTKFP